MRTCKDAVTASQTRLGKTRNLFAEVNVYDYSSTYSDYPKNRPQGYAFTLRGKSAPYVINSPQLMQAIARDIIRTCDTVGAVKFTIDKSDYDLTVYDLTIGLLPDSNRIGFFKAIAVDDNSADSCRPKWGEECSKGELTGEVGRGYPAEVVKNFVDDCMAGRDVDIRAACTCVINKIQHRYTIEEFTRYDREVANGGKPPETMMQMVEDCRDRT